MDLSKGSKKPSHIKGIAAIVALLAQPVAFAVEVLEPQDREYLDRVSKLKLNKPETRTLKLENELEVLMIHHPSYAQSAAALNVQVGFLQDPPRHRGLAHLLEHALFLSSEKYPIIDDFNAFVELNGGNTNAFTNFENTNFHFEVETSSFIDALDRFSRFFIDPTLDEKGIHQELENMDSEYSESLSDPDDLAYHLLTLLADPKHPQSKVFQGNKKSLQGVDQKILMNFFRSQYSSNLMKLVIMTSLPLDQVEVEIRKKFSDIRNLKIGRSPSDAPKINPQVITMEFQNSEKNLKLHFSLPPILNHRYSNPQNILGKLIIRTDEGSLFHYLKKLGWITELDIEGADQSFQNEWVVHFRLTHQGNHHWKEIVSSFFEYIQLLREKGLTPESFLNFQRGAELNYIFESPKIDLEKLSQLSENMTLFPAFQYETLHDLATRYSATSFSQVLESIRPDKMKILIFAPTLKGKIRQNEPLYDIGYHLSELEPEILRHWATLKPNPEMFLAPLNPYFPSNLEAKGISDAVPIQISNDERGQAWVQKNYDFNQPKSHFDFRISVPKERKKEGEVLREFYVRAFQNSMSRWAALQNEAGLTAELTSTSLGFYLSFSGFSEKLVGFAERVIQELGEIGLSKKEFEGLKEEWIDEIRLSEESEPLKYALDLAESLLIPGQIHEKQALTLISSIRLEDVKEYAQSVYKSAYVIGFGFGHVESDSVTRLMEFFVSTFKSTPLKIDEALIRKRVQLPAGQKWGHRSDTKDGNDAWFLYHQFGKSGPIRDASIEIGNLYLSAAFFTEMRTTRAIGYQANACPYSDFISAGYCFSMQSQNSIEEKEASIEVWIKGRVEEFLSISDEEFEKLRAKALISFDHALMNFEDVYSRSQKALFDFRGDWTWHNQKLIALKTVSKSEVTAEWKQAFASETCSKLSIRIRSKKRKQKHSLPHIHPDERIVLQTKLEKFHESLATYCE